MKLIDAKEKPANLLESAHLMPPSMQFACSEWDEPMVSAEQPANLLGIK